MPDSGYSWVILCAAVCLNIHHAAGPGSVGIFLLQFMEHFNVPKSAVTPILGLFLCIGFLFGFPMGWLCRSYGCRPVTLVAGLIVFLSLILSSFAPNIATLYFTYGFLASIGFGTFLTTSSIVIQQYFEQKRALASGVAVSGISIGVFIWGPLSQLLCDHFGWRGALLLLAGLHLHSLAFALLLRPVCKTQSISRKGVISRGEVEKTSIGRAKQQALAMISPIRDYPVFCGYMFGVLFGHAGHILPYSLLPTKAKALGIDPTLGATLVSIIGLSSGCMRTACGFIGDGQWVDRTMLSGLSATVAGSLTALSFFLTNYIQLAMYAALLGITSAAYIALQGATVVDLVGLANTAAGIGYVQTCAGFGHLLALTVSGKLLDWFSDPSYTFLVFGCIQILGGLIILVSRLLEKFCKRNIGTKSVQEELG